MALVVIAVAAETLCVCVQADRATEAHVVMEDLVGAVQIRPVPQIGVETLDEVTQG